MEAREILTRHGEDKKDEDGGIQDGKNKDSTAPKDGQAGENFKLAKTFDFMNMIVLKIM